MLKRVRGIFNGDNAAERDAAYLYAALMEQSRDPAFYRDLGVPDTQEGRAEVLILHVAPVMHRLAQLRDNGKKLSQALFDALRENFDIGLREEGYTDSGVKRRIKPLIQRFYAGLAAYTKAFDSGGRTELRDAVATDLDGLGEAELDALAQYMRDFRARLDDAALGRIARARLDFPATDFATSGALGIAPSQ